MPDTKVCFYTRGGKAVPAARVQSAKQNDADARRTGRYAGGLRCNINPRMAERIESMTLIEYCNWSGAYTYRQRKAKSNA